jgi:hypothetical protein
MASFYLFEVGNQVMKSMEMVSHFHSRIGRGCNNLVGCQCSALTCWHSMHFGQILGYVFLHSKPIELSPSGHDHLLVSWMTRVGSLCSSSSMNLFKSSQSRT